MTRTLKAIRNKALGKSVLKKDPKESGKRKPKRIIKWKTNYSFL